MALQYNGSMEGLAQQGLWYVLGQWGPEQVDSSQVKVYQKYIYNWKKRV